MRCVIISIGDEILNGTTINTNASWISVHIQKLGIDIYEVVAVSDKKEHILQTLEAYTGTCDLIFITGGLGPTKDDITKTALCEFFGSELIFHEELYNKLKHAFEKRDMPFPESNRSQALYPHNCTILRNSMGSAQGMWFTKKDTHIISMPGVPFEMHAIMKEEVIPRIQAMTNMPVIINRYLMTSGMGESRIAELIEEVDDKLPPHISLAYLPAAGMVKLRLTARGSDRNAMQEETDKYAEQINSILGNTVYSNKEETLETHIGQLLLILRSTLGTAESCTGGKIAHKLTSVPGSSEYYAGSVVTYSYQLKTALLNVSPETLNTYGAVSEETVSAMLTGALQVLGVDFAIAVSGIAGPGGGTADKPVGLVYIAVGDRHETRVSKHLFNKTREVNIEYSTVFALHALRMLLLERLEKQVN